MSSRGSGNRPALQSGSSTQRSVWNGSQRCGDDFPAVGKPDDSTAAGAVSGDSCASERLPWGPRSGLRLGVLPDILSAGVSVHGTKCGILKDLTKVDDVLPVAEALVARHFLSRGLSTLVTRCPLMFEDRNYRGALPSTGGGFSFLRSDFRTVEKGVEKTWPGGNSCWKLVPRSVSADFRSTFGHGSVIQAIVLRQAF